MALQAAFRSGSIFEACDDLLQTGDAYSAEEKHRARVVVRILLASVPQWVFSNFLRMPFLAPVFALIYIIDSSRETNKFKYILFADDTNLISNTCSFKNNSSQHNIDQISLNSNAELGKVSDWMSANKLSLNTSKSKFIIFSYRLKKMGNNKIPTLKINGAVFERKR